MKSSPILSAWETGIPWYPLMAYIFWYTNQNKPVKIVKPRGSTHQQGYVESLGVII